MTDIFSKAAKAAKQAKQQATVKPAVEVKLANESKDAYEALNEKLQKAVIYAAFYAVYQKSGSLYNQSSVEGLLENVEKALSDEEYAMFAGNVGVITSALAAVQADIITPLSANDIIKNALAASSDESPKAVINRLISEKSITGADARRYLEHLLGW